MSFVAFLLSAVTWSICHKLIGLSELTSLSFLAAPLLTYLSLTNILSKKKAKKRISKSHKCQAVILEKQSVHGYRGRTTYTVELHFELDKVILKTHNLPRSLQINDTFDTYPIYDKNHNIIDLDYDAELQTKLMKPINIAAVLSILLTIFLVINDGHWLIRRSSPIVSGLFLVAYLMPIGYIFLRRYIISRKKRLTPVKAIIHNIIVMHQTLAGEDKSYINPIYRAVIEGKAYQFSGSDEITEEDKGKEVTVYYDKSTMGFFELRDIKSKNDLFVTLVMLALSIGILYAIFK